MLQTVLRLSLLNNVELVSFTSVCLFLLRIEVISTTLTHVILHMLFIFLGNGTGGESIYGGYFAGAVTIYSLFSYFLTSCYMTGCKYYVELCLCMSYSVHWLK